MLAELADVSSQYISLLENGKRGKKVSFSVMCRLSNALNIPIEALKDLELNFYDDIKFIKARQTYGYLGDNYG